MSSKSNTFGSVVLSSPTIVPVETGVPSANHEVFTNGDSPKITSQPIDLSDRNGAFHSINRSSNPSTPSIKHQSEQNKSIVPKKENKPTSTTNTPSQPKHRNLAKSLPTDSSVPTNSQMAKKTNSPSSQTLPPSPSLSPWCQNCQTSTTPLWRRDESGQILCNACGLFLKLHGRPRPISLKTDTIKSRNRNKNNQNLQQGSPGSPSSPLDSQSKSATDVASKTAKPKSRKRPPRVTKPKNPVQNGTFSAQSSPALTPAPEQTETQSTTKSPIYNSSLLKNLCLPEDQPIHSTASPVLAPATTLATSATPSNITHTQKESLPPLMASLDPTHISASHQQTPYMNWVSSPSFNPLTRSTHLPALNSPAASPFISSTTLNALAPLHAVKDGDANPFSPLRPPIGSHTNGKSIRSLMSESHTPAHQSHSLQAITSPLLLASTPSSHLYQHSGSSLLLNPSKSQYDSVPYKATNSSSDLSSSAESSAPPTSAPPQGSYPAPLNPARTALDHLTSAACTSPYLAPAPQRPDTRLPPIISPYDSQAPILKNSAHEDRSHSNSMNESTLSTPSRSEVGFLTSRENHGSTPDNSQYEHGGSNQALHNRVAELEIVNDLLKSRIAELETSEEAARRSEAIVRESEILLRVRVNKLEKKSQTYVKEIKKLHRIIQDSGKNSVSSVLEELEDELNSSDDDDDNQSQLTKGNREQMKSSNTRTVMMMLQNGDTPDRKEGNKTIHDLKSLEEPPSKKQKTEL